MIPSDWLDELSEDVLTAKLARVVRTVVNEGNKPSIQNPIIIASYATVLEQVVREEGKAIRDDTFRQRLKEINAAVAKTDPQFRFVLRSNKPDIRLEFADGMIELMQQRATAEVVARSTEQDTSSAPENPQEPRALAPYKVFVSHAWDIDAEIESVLDDFIKKLKHKLSHLTSRQRSDLGVVELWFDRDNANGGNEFREQTDPQCVDSRLAIFVLSDKWYHSEACQIERLHFCETDGTPHKDRVFCVQLTGKREDANDKICDWPNFPTNWRGDWKTLIRLWSDGSLADKEEFVAYVRDEICNMLRRQGTRSPSRPPLTRKRLSPKPDFDSAALDEHVRSNEVEDINAFEGRRTTSNSVPLLPKLMEWACNDEAKNRVYAILGSFGAGKTTAAQLLAKELVKLGESDESAPFPVYLDFRRLQGKGDAVFSADANLGTIIAHCMDPFSAGKLDVENVIAYLRNKRCVLIFDGLDEIGTLVGIERATNLYRQLLQIIEGKIRSADARENAAQWALSPLRILITCRTHFFRDHIAEAAALNDYDRSGTLAGRKDNNVFKSLYMAPFTPEQIDNFFIRTLGEEAGQDAVNTIRRIHDLEGLASKPVMTRYIADLVPDLESDHEVGRTINAATIYGHLFRRAMERDGGKAQRMSIADREDLLEAFALFLWQSRTVQTNCKTLENWFDAYVENVPGLRLAFQVADGRSGLHTELRNTSFLIREADENFRFSHTSFYEYFLARGLTNALNQQAFDRFENTPEISRETLDFLVDLAETKKDVGALLRGIDKVLTGDASVERRQMALKILNHCLRRNIRHNLPDYADLSALDLKDSRIATGHLVRLQNIRFTAADFSGTWFSRLHFRNCDFDRTNLAQSSFDQCTFEACTGTPRGLASACARLSPGVTKLPFKVQPILSFRQENSHGSKKGIPATMDKGHEDRLTSVAFAPDGRTVLTGSDDKTCRLWGVSSGKTIMIFKGHEHEVTSVAFAPDGRTVLTGSDDKTCRLWDVSSGKTIMIFKGHEHEVTSVAFAPDGHTVLTGSYDNVARLWDVASGETVMAFKGHKGVVTSVAFALDGHTVLTGSHDHTARLWDVASGKALMTFGGHEQEVTSVAFAPDGVTVLTGSYDCTARLWDVASGKTIIIFKHHEFGVASVAFAPDGHAVLTGSFDNTARLWDSASGKTLMIFKGHDYGVTGVGFAPDGRTLLTGSDDHTARLWDVASSDTVITLKGHDNWLASIALAPDGGTVLTGSCDNTVRLWNVASGETIMTFEGHEDEVSCVAFAPNGRTVLTGSCDNTAWLWDVTSGEAIMTFKGHEDEIVDVAFSPDGCTVLTGSLDHTARLWDVASGEAIMTFTGHEHWLTSVACAPDGCTVLTGSHDHTARLWDVASGETIMTFKGHENRLSGVVFAPDGRTVLTGSYDNTARLWDVASGETIMTFEGHKDLVTSVAFALDGRTILTGSNDHTARLWEVASGDTIMTYRGHGDWLTSVAFAPDGRTVLTGSDDDTARLWDVASGVQKQGRWTTTDGWLLFNADEHVIRMSETGWKYIKGVASDETGFPITVCPDLPDIVFDKTDGSKKANTHLVKRD